MPDVNEQNQIPEIGAEQELTPKATSQEFGPSSNATYKDLTAEEIRVAMNAVRIFRHGVRVANGKGLLASPPAVLNPQKNADYQRFFVDSGNIITLTGVTMTSGSPTVTFNQIARVNFYYAGVYIRGTGVADGTFVKYFTLPASPTKITQLTMSANATADVSGGTLILGEGIGIINAPMSDLLWFKASGESPNGDLILQLRGPKTLGDTYRGAVDLSGVLGFLVDDGSLEAITAFCYPGAAYYNSATGKIRYYNGVTSAWADS